MILIVIGLSAFITAGLTLFSGFGLGTLLLPAFAIFFPIEVAVGLTAVVHFLNNLFKLGLLGKYANKKVIIFFGIPALFASFFGAEALLLLSKEGTFLRYQLFAQQFEVSLINIVMALLMAGFAMLELLPWFRQMSFGKKYLPLGGLLSGFFGGLSGHQGALRSAFLLKSGLTKESYIGTGVVIALLVDVARLFVYSNSFTMADIKNNGSILLVAILSAFLGSFCGNRMVEKVTLQTVQVIVSILLIAIAVGLGLGLF